MLSYEHMLKKLVPTDISLQHPSSEPNLLKDTLKTNMSPLPHFGNPDKGKGSLH